MNPYTAMGYFLVTLPFIALFVLILRTEGLRAAAFVFGWTFIIMVVFMTSFYLLGLLGT